MNKSILLISALLASLQSFSQVTIEVPYKKGEIKEVINISYESTKKIDSVSIETGYSIYGKEHPGFEHSKTVTGTPSTITLDYSLENKKYLRTYRCLTYFKGSVKDSSNEVTISYNAYQYDTTALAKVTGLTSELITINDTLYVHLKWNPVPNAFAYAIGEKINGSYHGFQIKYGGPNSKTIKTDFYIPINTNSKVLYYNVGAINAPYEGLGNINDDKCAFITVTLP